MSHQLRTYIDFFFGWIVTHAWHTRCERSEEKNPVTKWMVNKLVNNSTFKTRCSLLLPTKLIRCELIIYMISTNLCFDRICLCHLKVCLIGGEYKSSVAASVSCGLVRCRYRVRNPVAANFFFFVVNKGARSTGFWSNEHLIIYRYLAIFCLALSQATISLQPTTDRTTVYNHWK